ncbi:hypothetical protein CIPAW_03G111400 [Carya illinoinensis]|uniref:Uncharacterized protein n=2 Tax=Carya illinoinensis TaxID=32201 RepID=A0A8T1R1V7_CARIL|nr:hypothetical protein CIPAW_03G111400 [Carya illinoinensis]
MTLPQGNMRFGVKRHNLLGFLVLTTLFLAWSLFFTGEKLGRSIHASDGNELSGAVTVKRMKVKPFDLAKLMQQRPPEPPPPPPQAPPGPKP